MFPSSMPSRRGIMTACSSRPRKAATTCMRISTNSTSASRTPWERLTRRWAPSTERRALTILLRNDAARKRPTSIRRRLFPGRAARTRPPLPGQPCFAATGHFICSQQKRREPWPCCWVSCRGAISLSQIRWNRRSMSISNYRSGTSRALKRS